jgi:hypothetical protein
MSAQNTNRDFQQKVKNEEGRFQAYYYNNLALLDPDNKLAGRPRKLLSLKSTTDLNNGRINNQLSLTDQFRIYSTIPIRALYPGFYPTAISPLTSLTYSGTYRTLTVNSDARYVMLMMWGGGGQSASTPGGGGAYIQGYLPVTPGEQLRIIVGSGGNRGKQQSDVDGGGGYGGEQMKAGGGRTAVQRFVSGAWTDVVVAGGGGGGGNSDATGIGGGGDATATGTAYVGRAGNTFKSRSISAYSNQCGGGGSQTTGGLGVNGNAFPSTYGGGKGIGGNAGNYSGGGGGGWYGGGGGGQSPPHHGAGGGGSSYSDLLVDFSGEDGNDGVGGGSTSPYRLNQAGNQNRDGLLYYQYYQYLP